MRIKVKVGKPGDENKKFCATCMEIIKSKRIGELELDPLRFKPADIEASLHYCTTQEECSGCPMFTLSKSKYCGQILNIEALRYIKVLKYLIQIFAQRIEELEGVFVILEATHNG